MESPRWNTRRSVGLPASSPTAPQGPERRLLNAQRPRAHKGGCCRVQTFGAIDIASGMISIPATALPKLLSFLELLLFLLLLLMLSFLV